MKCFHFLISSFVAASVFVGSNIVKAGDKTCVAVVEQDPDDTTGGGGISGVGGGAVLGFIVSGYVNPIFSDTMPQYVQLEKLSTGKIRACVYDHHFRQAPVLHLVATLTCRGEETMKWPYDSRLRLNCTGPLGHSVLNFEATVIQRNLMGIMSRVAANGATNTVATMIGF